MANLNKVQLIGNLSKGVELRYASSGAAIANMTVATNRKWKDRNTNEWKEEAEFHRVSLFGRLAEVAGEYLRKGSSVYIEGRLQTRKWQDKGGQDRYTTEIVADVMQMLGGRESSDSGGYQAGSRPNEYERQKGTGTGKPHSTGTSFDDMDDDYPPF